MSGRQVARQQARRRVAETLAIKQRERDARDRHCAELAVLVVAALAERDATVEMAERTAAAAVGQLLEAGLTAVEVSDWCGGIGVREVNRLSRLATLCGQETSSS
ncbi:MAG: hypothetical protein KIT69_15265 [Propionibacteriaceae bacterium]|nr:hypothetical protein [Propionibacteriaceae bacterium]